jgi:hypothetical protein
MSPVSAFLVPPRWQLDMVVTYHWTLVVTLALVALQALRGVASAWWMWGSTLLCSTTARRPAVQG